MTTVLFDLDGTLVDTAPDLGYALNLQLQKYGKQMLSDDAIRPFASHGSKGLHLSMLTSLKCAMNIWIFTKAC
jgi:phosphoglycolate phosphatase-like HAD superfamily hydrolase